VERLKKKAKLMGVENVEIVENPPRGERDKRSFS
jgi:hypothetical protein